MGDTNRRTVAVIGAGVSGLSAAHVLNGERAVTLYEADTRLGGHAHTHDVAVSATDAGGDTVPVDSGFIVHNERTYPHLLRLFADLGVETRPTEMSMSITCSTCGLSYAGGRGARGIFAQPWRAGDPRFIRMLAEVPRFHRAARRVLESEGDETTWGDFLASLGYSEHFVRHFAVPLVSCVWSADEADALAYPARHLFRFLDHHGMLSVSGSPTWRTVVGGSRTYVERVAERLPDVRREAPVVAVRRHPDGVDVVTRDGSIETYDQVVLATHADQALELLADATPEEKQDLGAIGYSTNEAVLHRDSSLLPGRPAARASWNHVTTCGTDDARASVAVTYWMNRLQGLDTADDLLVTLNGSDKVDPDAVIAQMDYDHPIFTPEAVRAAERLREAGGDRLAFAGAHLGWGFHEDGCRSGVDAARALGVSW
ncbi:NAD(P)/FAD-dependent oxidoreductase [Nocardioides sp. GXZ039]|uniref:NAD(P)/FAD-dependent oxidoreductase n=1 Tax=Nocardioides sp. GXZ039 TaxID=3136018 RepID=UPI0030F436B5